MKASRLLAKKFSRMVRCPLPVYAPKIADTAKVKFRVGFRRELQHAAMPACAVAATDLPDLYSIVGAENPAIRIVRCEAVRLSRQLPTGMLFEKDPQTYLPFRARPSVRSDCILAPISVMIQLLRGNVLGTPGTVVKLIEKGWTLPLWFAVVFAIAARAQSDSETVAAHALGGHSIAPSH